MSGPLRKQKAWSSSQATVYYLDKTTSEATNYCFSSRFEGQKSGLQSVLLTISWPTLHMLDKYYDRSTVTLLKRMNVPYVAIWLCSAQSAENVIRVGFIVGST